MTPLLWIYKIYICVHKWLVNDKLKTKSYSDNMALELDHKFVNSVLLKPIIQEVNKPP